MRRNLVRFDAAAEDLRVGKISGAVGAFGHIGPAAEEKICERLGLGPAAIASQVIARDRHAAWVSALAILAATLEKIALEIRHLQRTEVREAEEPFTAGQKGSSAMPHKRNPVTAEQICGLARIIRGNVNAAIEDIALWHERDISHSSVERVILADSAVLADYLLAKTTWLVDGMRVYPERMAQNLESTKGLVFSGQLLLDLAAAGMLREQAYRLVQYHAMQAWESGGDFRAIMQQDKEVLSYLSIEKINEAFSVARHLSHVDAIFRRVFPYKFRLILWVRKSPSKGLLKIFKSKTHASELNYRWRFTMPLEPMHRTPRSFDYDLARVLLVDDDPASRITLKTVLEASGYHVESAASAAEAVGKLEDVESMSLY